MRQKKQIVAVLIVAHIFNALLYLQFPAEMKYDERYEDRFALWFFGSEYAFICAIAWLRPSGFWLDLFCSHLCARAVLYILYFSDIYSENIIARLGFIMLFLLILSIKRCQKINMLTG